MRDILILDDDIESLSWMKRATRSAFPDCSITEACSVRDGIAAVSKPIDLALLDLRLHDGSGIKVLRRIRMVQPNTICIIVSMIGDDEAIVAALSAGANGYILKEQPLEQFRRQLLQLKDGQPALSPTIARRIMEHFRLTGPAAQCDTALSEREKQVLALISRGLRNNEVAQTLGIAACTVATHIKSIYRKLGISSRAEASWHAARFGL